MPGKVKVKIVAGRNLPVMDRSSDTTDAFVEVKLGSTTFKTEVFRKSLNPQWNSEWFKFEVDDEELQDEPLQIRIMDHDTYSAHDAIGKVYVDLNPLLGPHSGPSVTQHVESNSNQSGLGTMLSGWFPVFDTMHGVRGEIFLVVKVELFSDVNRFRQSSCGVRFFNTPGIPSGYNIFTICGFVEELVVNDDPEYQWIDKIRTQRSSNEARQTLFLKLSGEVRRRIGLKTLELGGNAVIGYKQFFDLEGESGVVVRGIGTVASLHKKGSAAETAPHSNSIVADLLTNAMLEEMTPCRLRTRKLTPKPVRVERVPRYNPFSPPSVRSERSIRKPSEFLGTSERRWSLPLKIKIMNFVRKVQRGFSKNLDSRTLDFPTISEVEGEAGCSAEGEELTCLNPTQISLKTVEEHISIFDSHAELALESGESQGDVGQDLGRIESVCFITSSESECSSTMSPEPSDFRSGQSLTLPKIRVDAPFYSFDAVNEFSVKTQDQPSRLRKRACTLPNLCQCPSSVCGGLTCVSLSVPDPLTIRHNGTERYGSPSNQKLVKLPVVKKKSSESDLSTTPKGLSSSCELHHSTHMVRQVTGSQHIYDLQHEMSEYPFLTLSTYPRNFIVHIGGTVSARSVKLLDRITNPDEPETRDAWWSELRLEVRSHARALGCTFVLGYTEQTSICDEVCILSASGTAAVVDFQQIESFENRTRHSSGGFGMTSSFEREKLPKDQRSKDFVSGFDHQDNPPCSPCHVPYLPSNIPCPVKLSRCNSCRKHKVPDVLLATIEIPRELRVEGRGCLIQARVCRAKREYRSGGDSQAREVSDALPFLEYELHRQLLAKLRVRGMNAVFGLHVEVSIGEKHIIGLATGTAVFLSSLPPGRPPAISATGNKEDQLKVAQLSKKLMDLLVENREFYGIKESVIKHLQELDDEEPKTSDMSEGSDDELPDIHFVADNKDTCILEIDDPSELDIASILADDRPPKSFHCSTTELVPGLDWKNIENNYLAFTRVWQGRGTYPFAQKQLDDCFNILLQGLYFQLRRASPCLISGLRFAVDLPDEETIQITIFGMASRLKESLPARESSETASADASLIFKLDEDQVNGEKKSQREGFQPKNEGSPRDHPVIEITPLSRVPGTKIEKYLGNLNFFFIRESTSIRESGGLSTLVASFVSEVFAIARAHVAALGGNAMVAFTMSQYVLVHNPHKNQGQCLINASGDAVFVSEKHSED